MADVEEKIDPREDSALIVESVYGQSDFYAANPKFAVEGHAFLKGVEAAAKSGVAALRPVLEGAAQASGGTFTNDFGKATYTWVEGKETVEVTASTTTLLENKGILSKTVDILASLKAEVDLDAITEEELAIIHKYFDVQYHVNQRKLAAQVELGNVTQVEVDATLIRTPGTSHGRLLVTPNKETKKRFMP